MKLSDIFSQLTHGEFSQLHLGGGEAGAIDEANYPALIDHINLGLAALYTRFSLKENRVLIQLIPGLRTYILHSNYAEHGRRSRETVRYLKDSANAPFNNDVIKIERVYTADNLEMSLNDKHDPYSLHTSSMTTLVVPDVVVTGSSEIPEYYRTPTLDVAYRASHPLLHVPIGYFDPERVTIELPYSHLEALLLFVASRVHNPIGMVNEFNAGNNYYAKYEVACKQLETSNVQIDQGSQNIGIQRGGWV